MTIPEVIAIAISLGSAIVAVLAYRRAGNLKKLDQLVDAGRAQNELRESYTSLSAMHQTALRNRKAVMSAIGSLRSGSMQKMEADWNADAIVIAALETEVANSTRSPNSMSPSLLADLLVEIDGTKRSVDVLVSKYREWDDWDKQQQQRIREERLAQFQAGRTSSPT
jgi:hypothetical protein